MPFAKYIKQQLKILHFVSGGLFHVLMSPTASSLRGVGGLLISSSYGVFGVCAPAGVACSEVC
jgi:hypothetical protein